MKKYISLTIFIVILLFACNGKKEKQTTCINSTFYIPEQESDDSISRWISDIKYIKLDTCQSALFSAINKIIIENEKIYLFQLPGESKVLVFNMNGQFITQIGKTGGGPGEYERLRNFSVSNDTVYLLNRQRKQLLCYHSNGTFLESKEMPFKADDICCIDNGFLFALNKTDFENKKVIVTDRSFNILSTPLYHSEYETENFLCNTIFSKNRDIILYNRPVNDTLFIFNLKGEVTSCINLDFGKRSVPLEMRSDYMKIAEDFLSPDSKYSHMNQCPILLKDYIVGNVIQANKKWTYLLDKTSNSVVLNRFLEANVLNPENINTPIAQVGENTVVSYINADIINKDSPYFKTMPQDVQDYIEDAGYVITLCDLK